MTQGIYKITGPNNRVYIGQSPNIEQRWIYHLEDLRANRHINWMLQATYNKYGAGVFKFEIVEIVEHKYLREREAFYIRENWKNCYNIKDESEHISKQDYELPVVIESIKPYSNKHVFMSPKVSSPNIKLHVPKKHYGSNTYKGINIIIPYGIHCGKQGVIVYMKRALVYIDLLNKERISFPFHAISSQLPVDRE